MSVSTRSTRVMPKSHSASVPVRQPCTGAPPKRLESWKASTSPRGLTLAAVQSRVSRSCAPANSPNSWLVVSRLKASTWSSNLSGSFGSFEGLPLPPVTEAMMSDHPSPLKSKMKFQALLGVNGPSSCNPGGPPLVNSGESLSRMAR